MKFTSVNGHILVRNSKDSETLIVSREAENKISEGEVVTENRIDLNAFDSLRDGYKILFSTSSSIEVNINGEDLLIINKKDIIGIITQRDVHKQG